MFDGLTSVLATKLSTHHSYKRVLIKLFLWNVTIDPKQTTIRRWKRNTILLFYMFDGLTSVIVTVKFVGIPREIGHPKKICWTVFFIKDVRDPLKRLIGLLGGCPFTERTLLGSLKQTRIIITIIRRLSIIWTYEIVGIKTTRVIFWQEGVRSPIVRIIMFPTLLIGLESIECFDSSIRWIYYPFDRLVCVIMRRR